MRVLVLTVALLLLATCGRPLTEGEIAFLDTIHGDQIDPAPIRIAEAGFIGLTSRTYPERPRTTCRERILPPPDGPTFEARTAGVILFDQGLMRPDWYLDDYTPRPTERLNLVAAMFFAHEMTHVWQWQNRDRTGYHPFRAAAEHLPGTDPYLFEETTEARFLDYPFEQQASLVEEYVCCRALDPEGARTDRLKALISQELPISDVLPAREILLPWSGLDPRGICA